MINNYIFNFKYFYEKAMIKHKKDYDKIRFYIINQSNRKRNCIFGVYKNYQYKFNQSYSFDLFDIYYLLLLNLNLIGMLKTVKEHIFPLCKSNFVGIKHLYMDLLVNLLTTNIFLLHINQKDI